jgi:hypothetical protein
MTDEEVGQERRGGLSGAAVVAVGAVLVAVLLPLVLGTWGQPKAALVVAAPLLTFAAVVRPEGAAAPLRWIPWGFGTLALVAGVVGIFT